MQPVELFRFCPQCGAPRVAENVGRIPLRCERCALVYFFNPTVAAAAWVSDSEGRVLLIRRAHEPAKGKFGIPGGFIDIGETAEQALRREVQEEVGLQVTGVAFLSSFPNLYSYQSVTYPVLDLVFTATAVDPGAARPLDGVAGIEWHRAEAVNLDECAFPSIKESLKLLLARS